MSKIKITCDSTCDLTPELYEKYQVSVSPLCVTLGDDLHRDSVDVTAQDIFAYVDQTGNLPKTSAISVGEYEEFFQPFVDDGCSVIHINISSEFSACYQNACLAAQNLGNVYPIDSRNLSTGSAHLVLAAAEMAQQGVEAAQIAEELKKLQARVDASFVLQTLEYLKKGGRISKTVAFAGGVLNIKPVVTVSEGEVALIGKARGSRNGNNLLVEKIRQSGGVDFSLPVLLGYTGLSPALLDKYVEDSRELWADALEEIPRSLLCSVIGTHVGPGAVAAAFFKKG